MCKILIFKYPVHGPVCFSRRLGSALLAGVATLQSTPAARDHQYSQYGGGEGEEGSEIFLITNGHLNIIGENRAKIQPHLGGNIF